MSSFTVKSLDDIQPRQAQALFVAIDKDAGEQQHHHRQQRYEKPAATWRKDQRHINRPNY